jgi:predicted metalloprotease
MLIGLFSHSPLPMARPTVAVIAMALAAAEPVIVPEQDLIRYGITQGGLVLVVLVIFWSYRRDLVRLIDAKDQNLRVLTELVASNTSAATRMAEAVEAQEKVIERLTSAIDRLDERRFNQQDRRQM